MSADNWARCPQCAIAREAQLAEKRAEVFAAYGKLSISEFDALRDSFDAFREIELTQTFREDYEIYGAEDGVVRVEYTGSCTICTTRLSFTHEVPIGSGA